jgi:hypothetical protein
MAAGDMEGGDAAALGAMLGLGATVGVGTTVGVGVTLTGSCRRRGSRKDAEEMGGAGACGRSACKAGGRSRLYMEEHFDTNWLV